MKAMTRYQIMKRVAILLNMMGYFLFGGGIYTASEGHLYSLLLFLGMAILYWVSSELDYHVQEMLVRLYSKGGK